MPRVDQKNQGPAQRLLRVAELIRHAAADVLARGEIDDPLLLKQIITIPTVRMSPDLKLATLSVAPLGGKPSAAALKALDRNKKMLRALIAQRVNLKFAPDLRFVADESFDAFAKIDAILRSPEVARDLEAPSEDDETS
jgi:ribosome-binding factor A